MKDTLLGALALVLLATSLGLAQVQLFGPKVALLQPYRAPMSARIGVVDVPTAYQLFQEGSAVFVDAREAERYQAGHVPGAVNVAPDGDLTMLPYGGTMIVYCDGAECGASARVAERLVQIRTGQTVVMTDGWPGWEAAGHPVMP